ncbi:porin [Vibrio sp.]|uniref:porin n=1 Tax=Vibrio sp. TaxID=678 RepID=UPI003D0D1F55
MNMKLLAVAVAAAACGTSAFAAEVYSGDSSSLSIGGHVSVGVGEYSSDDVRVDQVSPRINVEGKQDIGGGVTVDAKGEWALNMLNGGGTSMTTRLGYIGASHDQAGRLVAGTQWSPYYDVGGVADLPIAFANDFLYDYNLGTARANRMLSYRNSFALGDMGALNFGLAWQGKRVVSSTEDEVDDITNVVTRTSSSTTFDTRGQVALSMDIVGIGVGYAYTGGDVTDGGMTNNAQSHIVSLKYGSYGSGLYTAVVYGMNKHIYSGVDKSKQLEALIAFGLGNGLNLSVNYESEKDDDADMMMREESALQAEYNFSPKFRGFAGYQFDLNDDGGREKDDKWIVGARYFL